MGTFVTLADAVVIMLVSLIFASISDMVTALWVTTGLYLLHGVVELVVGPWLVLRPAPSTQQQPMI